MYMLSRSVAPDSATLWTVARQAPLSMGFSMREYWGGLPCLPAGDLPDPGIEPVSLTSTALEGGFFITSATWEAPWCMRGHSFKNHWRAMCAKTFENCKSG